MSAVRRAIVFMPMVAAAPVSQDGACEAAVGEVEESTLLQKASVKAAKMAEVKAHFNSSQIMEAVLVAESFVKYPGSATTLRSNSIIDLMSTGSGNQAAAGGLLSWDLSGVDGRCTKGAADGIKNGCGIRVHEGYTCSNASEVGGNYWNKAVLDSDPWLPVKFVVPQSNTTGSTTLNTGYKLESAAARAMVVHDFDGKRIACSKITYNDQRCVPNEHVSCPGSKGQCSGNQCCPGGTMSGGKTFPCPSATRPESANCGTDTQVSRCVGRKKDFPTGAADDFKKYPGSSTSLKVRGKVGVEQPSPLDPLIIFWNLQDVDSRCTAGAADGIKNGCGIHIHEGMTCDDANRVEGHYWNQDVLKSGDPWLAVKYVVPESVSRGGDRVDFGHKLESAMGRAMVVNDYTGARMSCSLITHNNQACKANDHMPCPGSSSAQCTGNQCCPGVEMSGGKTFPCPSAAKPAEAHCQTSFQVSRCVG